MQSTQLVYLVGPITGCSYDECTDWRGQVKEDLEATGIYHCLTPMRGKEHLHGRKDLPGHIPEHIRKPGCTGHDILSRDFYDCTRADVVFCNLVGATITSIGSCFEMAWAFAEPSSYSVICVEEDNPHWHDFPLEAAGIVFPSVGEGVEYLVEVLNR